MKYLKKFNESEEIDNFTSQYYDNFDDEEDKDQKYKIDLQNFEDNNLSKIKLYEDWKKNLAAGALMTAATLGGMTKGQTPPPLDSNTKSEIVEDKSINQIKEPNDLINFVKISKEKNFSEQQLANFFDLQSKRHFINLIKTNPDWEKAFDKALEVANDYMREGTEYVLYIKSDKAKQLGQSTDTPISYENRKQMTKEFESKGLKEYKDFVFQVVTKSKDWNKMLQVYQALDYINWRFI